MIFFIFLHFFAILLEFSIPGRVGMDRNDNFFYFFNLIPYLSRPGLVWKEAITMFFNLLKFFALFLEFPIQGWVRMDRNDNIFFVSFSTYPVPFWLDMKP